MASTSTGPKIVPVAAPMPPELPVPTLSSPRVRAAMRVLGVHPKDVEPIAKEDFECELRYEVFERKRRRQIGEVTALAGRSPDSTSGHAPSSPMESKKKMLEDIAIIEARNVEVMNRMAKKDVQKIVIQELEAKVQAQKGLERQEGQQGRLKDLMKERNDKLRAQRKESAKKAEKNTEVRARAVRLLETEAKEVETKATAKDVKLKENVVKIEAGYEEFRVRNKEKREVIVDRVAHHEAGLVKTREDNWEHISSTHQRRMDALHDLLGQRESKTAEMQAKKDGCIARAKLTVKEAQDKKDTAYFAVLERHKTAAITRHDENTKKQKEFRKLNAKARTDFEGRYERVQKEIESHPNVSRRLGKSMSDSVLNPTFIPTNTSLMNEQMVDLVEDNRRQLHRAHNYSQERALAKIDGMRERVRILLQSRDTASKRRMEMMKNCATQKMQTVERVDRVRDNNNPDKMMTLLQELKPEPAAEETINKLLQSLSMPNIPGSAAARALEEGDK